MSGYRPRVEPLDELEKKTLAEWSRRDLEKRLASATDDPIAEPRAWQTWRYRELEKKALNPEGGVRDQLARLARHWDLVPKRAQPAEAPTTPATQDVVLRFRDLALTMLRLKADHPLHAAHAHLVEHGVDGLPYLETLEQVAADHGVPPYATAAQTPHPSGPGANGCPPVPFEGVEP